MELPIEIDGIEYVVTNCIELDGKNYIIYEDEDNIYISAYIKENDKIKLIKPTAEEKINVAEELNKKI